MPVDLTDHDLTLVLIEHSLHRFLNVPAYFFRITLAKTGDPVGRINLRAETTTDIELYAGHIGYEVEPAHRGHRYAMRALSLVLPFAREIGIDPVWVTCDPENSASRRSCEIAGGELVEIIDLPKAYAGYALGQRQKCRFRF